LREALARRDLGRARQAMDRESAGLDLFGLPRRTFYPHELQGLAAACGLTIIGEYGVRVFADLLDWQPPLDQLQALELAASARLPYRHIARFLQLVAVKEE
jgi:hypothetical protein